MAGYKINQLPRASGVASSDLFPKDNPGGTSTEAATAEQLREYILNDVMSDIEEKGEEVCESIEEKGEEVLASIPEDYTELLEDVADLKSAIEYTASALIGSVAGNPAVIPDAAANRLLSEVVAQIEPMQTGSGDPAPANIRPISGFTGAVIRHTGKNLWGGDALIDDIKAAIPAAVVDDEDHTVRYSTGNPTTNPLCGIHNGVRRGFQFAENTRYTFIFTMYRTGTSSSMRVTYTDGSTKNIPAAPELETKGTVVFVSDAGKTVERLSKVQLSGGGTVTIYAKESGIFEGVLTAEDFVPYAGTEVTVEFPSEAGTVYGGTLDVTAGTLTVDRANIASYAGETLPGEWISDRDVYATGTAPAIGAQVVYKLTTPITYQLTPVEIEALTEYNAIYTVCGPVAVKYVQNTGAAIDAGDASTRAMIGEVSGETASRSLAVGEYVTVGDKLYRVTSAIGAGETLVPGSNVTETTVGAELSRLAAMIS